MLELREVPFVATSYFALRRCVEHHGGVPDSDITISFKRILLTHDDKEITELPLPVEKGDVIRIRSLYETKTFPAGTQVRLTESDIEHIALTIRIIAAEMLHIVTSKS